MKEFAGCIVGALYTLCMKELHQAQSAFEGYRSFFYRASGCNAYLAHV